MGKQKQAAGEENETRVRSEWRAGTRRERETEMSRASGKRMGIGTQVLMLLVVLGVVVCLASAGYMYWSVSACLPSCGNRLPP